MSAESCCHDRWSERAPLEPLMMLIPDAVPPDPMLVLALSARQVRYYRPALEQAALALLAAMPTRPPATASETRKAQVAARRADLLETAQALRQLHALMPDPDMP